MLLAKVIGNVWSTKKKDEISALRLLFIQPLGKNLKPDGNVRVFDLKGICPQHVTMIGIFGDIADVKASITAIEQAEHLK